MKRKGIAPIFAILIVLAIVFTIGTGYQPVADFLGGDDTIDGCLAAEPTYGRFECVEMPPTTSETSISANDMREWSTLNMITCGDTENSKECGVLSVRCNSNKFVFQASDLSECYIGSSNWCERDVIPGTETAIKTSANLGDKIKMGGCFNRPAYSGYLCLGCSWESGTVYEAFRPYVLYQYESNGNVVRTNTKNCEISDDLSKVVTHCGGDEGCESAFKGTTRVEFGNFINYVDGYDELLDIDERLVTYLGSPAYCTSVSGGAELYSFTEVTTQGGTCYILPDNKIKSVDCCPGSETANAICEDDFQWHAKIITPDPLEPCPDGYTRVGDDCVRDAECLVSFDCTGYGQYVRDYSEPIPTVVKYGCVSGECVLQDKKAVECTPPNYGCASGYVCDPATFKCELQEGLEIICGDGICMKPYEDSFYCPQDCGEESERTLGMYFSIIARAVILALIITSILWMIVNFLIPVRVIATQLTGGIINRPQTWAVLFLVITLALLGVSL